MGIIDETDLEKYRKKLGIKKDIDLENADIDELLSEETGAKSGRKKIGYMQRLKKDFDKEEFKKILTELKAEKEKLKEMDEDEVNEYE